METLPPTLLVGMRRAMSQAADATSELWRAFRPRANEVQHRATDEMISMRIYPGSARDVYDSHASFWRWAAVEVTSHGDIPDGMEPYTMGGGRYAVFKHHGPATDLGTFRHIFGEWLPESGYQLAHREHFELLPPGYDPRDPDATEEIWIPVAD